MCSISAQSQSNNLVEQFHVADRRQRRKLITQIWSLAQQSECFWQGTSIDAEPYAEAYQAVMISLPNQLGQFKPSSELTFVKWLNRLLVAETLARSSKIWREGEFKHPELYRDAKQIALKELLEKFEEYDSKKGSVTNWFNLLLRGRFIDLLRRQIKDLKMIKKIEQQIIDEKNIGEGSLPHLPEISLNFTLTRKFINQIRQWAEDKHSTLRECCLRDRREVNCFTLILMRLPKLVDRQGELEFDLDNIPNWKMIALELDVPESTVRRHFKNHCLDHLKQAFPASSYL